MAQREESDEAAGWQHPLVSILQLAGLGGGSRTAGDAKARAHSVGDVKQIMDKAIGKRCYRIAGAVSAANYLEVPSDPRNAPLNLLGRYVYIQVRPIGSKAMTFHLDVLDGAGQPVRVTFSTLYSTAVIPPGQVEAHASARGSGLAAGSTTAFESRHDGHMKRPLPARRGTLSGGASTSNANGAASSASLHKEAGSGAGASAGGGPAALARRGGAVRCPISFQTSRSRGWTVIAVDMDTLMLRGALGGSRTGAGGGNGAREGERRRSSGGGDRGGGVVGDKAGAGGGAPCAGRGYGLLRGVRLGSNMIVRGVFTSDKFLTPRTLPKEMALPVRGGAPWESVYGWLWLPEVPDENAVPLPNGATLSARPAWPPGTLPPTSPEADSVGTAAHERRRKEKRHFQAQPSLLAKVLAQEGGDDGDDDDGDDGDSDGGVRHPGEGRGAEGDETVVAGGGTGRAALMERASMLVERNGKVTGRLPPASVAWASKTGEGNKAKVLQRTTGLPSSFPKPPKTSSTSSSSKGGRIRGRSSVPSRTSVSRRPGASPEGRTASVGPRGTGASVNRSCPRRRLTVGTERPASRGEGIPLTPRGDGGREGWGAEKGRMKRAPTCAKSGTGGAERLREGVGEAGTVGAWTREELDEWSRKRRGSKSPAVAVLVGREDGAEENGDEDEVATDDEVSDGGREEADGAGGGRERSEAGGGPDPPVVSRVLPPGLEASRAEPIEFEPDPALRLERALCYTGGWPGTLAFVCGDEYVAFPSNNAVVLMKTPRMPEAFLPDSGGGQGPAGISGITPAPHLFLRGHTDRVTRVELSNSGHLLATAQGDVLGAAGGRGVVRLWDTVTFGGGGNGGGRKGSAGAGAGAGRGAKCVANFGAHRWGVVSMCFSPDDRLLCTVGGDEHRRTQVIVWDVDLLCAAKACSKGGTGAGLALLARQISDFPITRMVFSPFEKQRLVSCGRENVRFWRMRRRHLPACPAVLNDFARDLECTDLAFHAARTGPRNPNAAGANGSASSEGDGPCVVYVSSRAGTLLQVSYHSRNLLCVLKLHDGPILSLTAKESYVITGSADKLLRLWPLDFSDFLMEAAHESAVVSTIVSKDGLKLAIGTGAGSIGVLDMATHGYTTALRSHRGGISAVAVDPNEEQQEFSTVSEDCTIRVWDLTSGSQRYQFSSPEDRPTCVAYAPPKPFRGVLNALEHNAIGQVPPASGRTPAAVGDGSGNGSGEGGGDGEGSSSSAVVESRRHLVGGYASGCLRVFDVPTTQTLYEFQQHHGLILQVVFTPDGARVISAGSDGLLCVHDAFRDYQPVRTLTSDPPAPGRSIGLAVSPGSDRLAVVGAEPYCVLLYDLASMVLKGRLGRTDKRTALQLWRQRQQQQQLSDGGAAGGFGGGDSPGFSVGGAGSMSGKEFLHAAFSGNGSDLLACTATKLFRFPLSSSGSDTSAWSARLPCKASGTIAACHAPGGPGLLLLSPSDSISPAVGTPSGNAASGGNVASGGGGGSGVLSVPSTSGTGTVSGGGSNRRGVPRVSSGGGRGGSSPLSPSELFMCQVYRTDRSTSIAISAPQVYSAHASPLTAAAFSASGKRLVTCDGTGVVCLWSNLAAPTPGAWVMTGQGETVGGEDRRNSLLESVDRRYGHGDNANSVGGSKCEVGGSTPEAEVERERVVPSVRGAATSSDDLRRFASRNQPEFENVRVGGVYRGGGKGRDGEVVDVSADEGIVGTEDRGGRHEFAGAPVTILPHQGEVADPEEIEKAASQTSCRETRGMPTGSSGERLKSGDLAPGSATAARRMNNAIFRDGLNGFTPMLAQTPPPRLSLSPRHCRRPGQKVNTPGGTGQGRGGDGRRSGAAVEILNTPQVAVDDATAIAFGVAPVQSQARPEETSPRMKRSLDEGLEAAGAEGGLDGGDAARKHRDGDEDRGAVEWRDQKLSFGEWGAARLSMDWSVDGGPNSGGASGDRLRVGIDPRGERGGCRPGPMKEEQSRSGETDGLRRCHGDADTAESKPERAEQVQIAGIEDGKAWQPFPTNGLGGGDLDVGVSDCRGKTGRTFVPPTPSSSIAMPNASDVRWHPGSGRIIYAQDGAYFAEDLASCQRCLLWDDCGRYCTRGESHATDDSGVGGQDHSTRKASEYVVAISPRGSRVARGSRRGGVLDVLSLRGQGYSALGEHGRSGAKDRRGQGSVFSGRSERRRTADGKEVEPCMNLRGEEELSVAAMVFSPGGSKLLVVSQGSGREARPTLSIRSASTGGVARGPAEASAHAGQALCPTWAICALSGRAAGAAAAAAASSSMALSRGVGGRRRCSHDRSKDSSDDAFLFATLGARGADVWLGVSRHGGSRGVRAGEKGLGDVGEAQGVGRVGTGTGTRRDEAIALGTASGMKGTVLAGTGGYIVAADLSKAGEVAGGTTTVTCVDATRIWVPGAGYQGLERLGPHAQFHEIAWQVFAGVEGAVLTCLASAGPERIAVAGRGSRLEIWDVGEAAAASRKAAAATATAGSSGADGKGGEPGAEGSRRSKTSSAGLVHSLDLFEALEGAAITDMTWEDAGLDAVLGAGGGVWHLRLPTPPSCANPSEAPTTRSRSGLSAAMVEEDKRESLTPTIARIWPGGPVNVEVGVNVDVEVDVDDREGSGNAWT